MSRAAQRERLNSVVETVRNALRDAKIGYTGLDVEGDAIDVHDPRPRPASRTRARLSPRSTPILTVEIAADGAGHDALPARSRPRRAAARRSTQSIEIIRRRIDETGTKEPTIQRQGQDRILVQLPGRRQSRARQGAARAHRQADLSAGRYQRHRRGGAARPAAAGRRDPAGAGGARQPRRPGRLCRAQARHGRRRHAGRRAAHLPEQRAGRQLPVRRRRRQAASATRRARMSASLSRSCSTTR